MMKMIVVGDNQPLCYHKITDYKEDNTWRQVVEEIKLRQD